MKNYNSPKEQAAALMQQPQTKWKPQSVKTVSSAFGGTPWLTVNDGDYQAVAKVYDVPSEYGIDEGRVSKLTLKHKGNEILNYDRGWDTKSGNFEIAPEHEEYYRKLLDYLNNYGFDE